MHILCRVLGHRRNKRKITTWRDGWQTECTVCSTRLTRIRRGEWVPIGSIPHMADNFRPYQRTQAD